MGPFKKSTTELPSALREELGLPEPKARNGHPYSQSSRSNRGGSSSNVRNGFTKSKSSSVVGRKEARKAARMEKKTKPTLKVIGKGLSAEQHERQKRDGGTAKSFMQKSNGKQRQIDLDEDGDDQLFHQMIQKEKESKNKKSVEGKKKNKKQVDPSSSSSSSSNPNPKKRSRDSIEDPKSQSGQRKHVSSNTQTPLERMLAKAENKSSKTKSKEFNVRKKPRSRMTQMEKDEEDEIRWLEAKLAKEKKGDDIEDDLDGFLEDLNRFQPGMYSDDDDDEEDHQDSEDDSGLEDALMDEDESEADDDDETDWDAAMQDSDAEMEDVDLSEEETDEEDESSDEEEENSTSESSPQSLNPKPTSSSSSSIPPSTGKYMPPAARAAAAAAKAVSSSSSGTESVALLKLRRQAQGQLNRLGENNIESILFSLTDLYDSNSRAEVSSTLISLILETISARADLGNRFVVLYAALVGGLHRMVGIEFGASIVQKVVEQLIEEYRNVREAQVKMINEKDESSKEAPNGKECVNLLILLSELYNLQIVACPLIYDLIRLFLRGGGEESSSSPSKGMVDIDIELLLKIVKSCGQQLRHDDPTSLKSIISLTQESVSKTPISDQLLGSRPKFMLETLNDLKNNRQRKNNNNKGLGDSNGNSSEELMMKMKKWLNGLSKKYSVRNFESLRIGLKDLQEAESKGKWWLVGAAWTGHESNHDENQNQNDSKGGNGNGMTIARPLIEETEPTDEMTSQLLKEARKHGMNTDSKRKIFLAIMSAEDYLDAGTKLLQLRLNEVQRRDIIRVLLHCLGQENVYNPYYTLIGTQLSKDSQDVRITLQYSLWDLLRELGEKNVGGLSKIEVDDDESEEDDDDEQVEIKGAELQKIVNIARAYGWWVAKGCLSLNALKTINFTTLKSKGKLFLRLFFIHLLLSIQSKSPSSVLNPSSSSSKPSRLDLESLESVLIRGTTGNQELSKGIQYFLMTELEEKKLKKLLGKGMEVETRKKLDWSLKKSIEIVGLRSQGLLEVDQEED